MSVTEQCDRILAAVDAAIAAPPNTCLVCGDESDQDHCGDPHCRHELWCSRRGLRSDFDLYADRMQGS